MRVLPWLFIMMTFANLAEAVDPKRAGKWHVGFGKVKVTPIEPVRLSGYASRTEPHTGVADDLYARAMVVSPSADERDVRHSVVLVSVDSILVTSELTKQVSSWLANGRGVQRSQLAISSTHSHAAPHVRGGLENLFRVRSTAAQVAATRRYTERMLSAIQSAITQAFSERRPGDVSISQSQVDFAVNRRLLDNGSWTGFGVREDGAVDRRLRLLRATDADGSLLGGAFLYACHCTTLGGDFNRISGDWAGLAASELESRHGQAVFLPVIGCGADANPNPRGIYDMAKQHANQIVTKFQSALQEDRWTTLSTFPVAHFGYAGLAPEQPSEPHLAEMAESSRSNERHWSQHMTKVRKEMGRLPETYPMPIHCWKFGEQLSWVFLGGEVVIEYQFQIERELPSRETWVAAYTDDVFAYVASEPMRSEGGYEVDFSMVYYLQPGRWQTGTQSLILRRVAEIWNDRLTESAPLSAAESLDHIRVPDDFRVELVASEPLVQDPINISFGADGRVWVVEMADYPRGGDGGRVKWLRDTNHDGRLDEATVFLDGLEYPTSVQPWRDGVLVIAAPNVIFARDVDGDGVADERQVLLTGIGEANPQHRASGFEIGLDGKLHFGAGNDTESLTSTVNGMTYDVEGHDVAWDPDTGEVMTTSGETQFVRSRDDLGNWYGNSNSLPMYQYVIENRYQQQVSVPGESRHHLLSPAVAPPVFPSSQVVDRFNDLFALNRFTSACSSIVGRVPGVAEEDHGVAFVCEPVHNLVARIRLSPNQSVMEAGRHPDDADVDFFASSDPWCRPVRVVNAPDGSIWILDMVRRVIEHPQWIPTSWQERLDLRAGADMGRIYRVYRSGTRLTSLPQLGRDRQQLLNALSDPNGALRDIALRVIMQDTSPDLEAAVRHLAWTHPRTTVRASALGCMSARGWLTNDDLRRAFTTASPSIVRLALELSESIPLDESAQSALAAIPERDLGAPVDLQWILTISRDPSVDTDPGLRTIVARSMDDPWIGKALSLVRDRNLAETLVAAIIDHWRDLAFVAPQEFARAESLVARMWQQLSKDQRSQFAGDRLQRILARADISFSPADLLLVTLMSDDIANAGRHLEPLQEIIAGAHQRMIDERIPTDERLPLVNLIGSGGASDQQEIEIARQLLTDPSGEIRMAAIQALQRLQSGSVPDLVLDHWSRFTSEQRDAACTTMMLRPAWVDALVTALEDGKLAPEQLSLSAAEQLRSYRNRTIRQRARQLFARPTERTKVVSRYLAELPRLTANDKAGALFQQHCAACHQSKPDQPQIGPPLENLKHWTIDQWLTAILDPNQAVEPKYLQSSLLTSDDRILTGIVLQRNAQETRIAQVDGSIQAIPTTEIVSSKQSRVSLMPEGFETKLNPRQMSQLLSYLRQR